MTDIREIVAAMRADLQAAGGFDNGMIGVPAEGVRNYILQLEAALAPVPETPDMPWRCFHCDEVFTDRPCAIAHFGPSEHSEPACQIDIAKYRQMESDLRRWQLEDTDLHREINRMSADHAVALVREEEKGYGKGLADGRARAASQVSGDALCDCGVTCQDKRDGCRYAAAAPVVAAPAQVSGDAPVAPAQEAVAWANPEMLAALPDDPLGMIAVAGKKTDYFSAPIYTAPAPAAQPPEDWAPLTGRTHELKTDAPVYHEVQQGRKRFEIRKNDRGFQCGDLLRLRATRFSGQEMAAGESLIFTGSELTVRVIHIMHGPKYGLADGWVVMSIAAAPSVEQPVRDAGWISVAERLPEPNQPCLVYWGETCGTAQIDIARLQDRLEGIWLWSGRPGLNDEITHWQPLPPAPEQTNG